MGYYIFSYGINTDAIHKSIGSNDNHLFNEIIETETFENYTDQNFAGQTTVKDALEHLIFNRPYNIDSAHAYGYALITICSYLGEQMPSTHEIKLGYETDLINGYLKSDFGITLVIEEELLAKEYDPFKLPPVQDWPLTGVLNKTNLVTLQQKLMGVAITDDMLEALSEEDEEKEMAYDSIRQIKENVSYCLDNGLELISFCH